MQIINSLIIYIQQLSLNQFKRYINIFLSVFFIFVGFLTLLHFQRTYKLSNKLIRINKRRLEVHDLLQRFEMVKKQKSDVNALLEKDQDFKIAGYFNNVLEQLNIQGKKTRDPETSSEELENGYREIKLYATFNTLNMKQVIDLLYTLEQNERIYTKEIEIYRTEEQERFVNVNLLIATLEPKIETME